MNSDKAVYYYFCLTVAVGMILITGVFCFLGFVSGFDPEIVSRIKKYGIFGVAFLVPPILYKIFATKEQESKNKKPLTLYYLIVGLIWAVIIGIASGFLKAGMIKVAVWMYISSIIPVFFFFWPMYYAIFEYFNDNDNNND